MNADESSADADEPQPPGDGAAVLTPREMDIVRLIVTGKKNRIIAAQLYISVRTVENHRYRIGQKLDCHSVVDLMHWAMRHGLL